MGLELLVKPAKFKEAIDKLGKKKRIAKKLSSKQWSKIPVQLRERAFFSANVENAKFLEKAQRIIKNHLKGAREMVTTPDGKKVPALKKASRGDFVYEMAKLAKESGMGDVLPPGVDREMRDIYTRMKDIQSEARLRLIFDTQTSQAQAYGYYKQGQDPAILDEFPAQRFIRAEGRRVPRPLHRRNTDVVKRKDDLAFWLRMNSQAIGGFAVPYGPWGFNSGMDVEDVDRDEAIKLGLIEEDEFIEQPDEKFNETLKASTEKMPPEILNKLKKTFGRSVQVKEGQVNWRGTGPETPEVPKPMPVRKGTFPALSEVKTVRQLGGSTGAQLVEDRSGARFVMKTGASPEHLLTETAVDEAYQVLGYDVPKLKVLESTRPTKLAEYIEGKTLRSYLRAATPAQAAKVKKEIQKGFVADALMGNWDVVGLEADNILVDKKGKVWRIDNGGALNFRAQGAKKTAAQWGKEVQELDTMLDKRINQSAAEIFEGISEEEILNQIEDLTKKKTELIAAVPKEQRQVIKDRIAYLEEYADKRSGPITKADVEATKKARGYGYSINMDKGDIEDTQIIAHEEKLSKKDDNKLVTKVEMRLTEEGAEKVQDVFKAVQTTGKANRFGTSDAWDNAFIDAAKSQNYHQAKGESANKMKIGILQNKMNEIVDSKKKGIISDLDYLYYEDYFEKLTQAVDKKTPAPIFKPRNVELGKPAPAQKSEGVLKRPKQSAVLKYPAVKTKKGNLSQTDATFSLSNVQNYTAEVDDVKVTFLPYTGEQTNYALQGRLQLEMPGGASEENLNKARTAMAKLGIDASKPSKDYEEALYLTKNLRFYPNSLPEKKALKILKQTELPDSEKLAQIEALLPPKYKANWRKQRELAKGKKSSFGVGRKFQERLDIPFEEMEKQMSEYTLTHYSSLDSDEFVELVLENGGQVSSITDRVRKGQQTSGGMSAGTDLKNGVADYFFTRIKKKNEVKGNLFTFKIGNLSRLDSQSFKKDWAGGVQKINSPKIRAARQKTISQLKQAAAGGDNETLFKKGLNFLDDIDRISVSDSYGGREYAKKMLKIFKQNKITKLPDGRRVEELFYAEGERLYK